MPAVKNIGYETYRELFEAGWGNTRIARHLGVSRSTVNYHCRRYKAERPEGVCLSALYEAFATGEYTVDIARRFKLTRGAVAVHRQAWKVENGMVDYSPTPAEIARRRDAIKEGWTEQQRQARIMDDRIRRQCSGATIPGAENAPVMTGKQIDFTQFGES